MAFYEAHPDFQPPADPETRICRYMSLAALLQILKTVSLRFTVARAFDDAWEGRLPDQNRAKWSPALVPGYENMRNWNAVSCWCMGDEATGMWAKFAHGCEGVAIQSTYRRLTSTFRDLAGTITFREPILVGMVTYIDVYTDEIPAGPGGKAPNAFLPLLYKRRLYDDERELRAVLSPRDLLRATFEQEGLDGIQVPVDLDTLIEGIRVAPGAKDWFREVVKWCVGGRYPVEFSQVDDGPAGAKRQSSIDGSMVTLKKPVVFP
jgi:hypothetical protein